MPPSGYFIPSPARLPLFLAFATSFMENGLYTQGYYAVNRTDVVTSAICGIRLGLNMLCTSAASALITMRRLKNNPLHSLTRRAATTALLFGLSMPALATTTHRKHHAADATRTPVAAKSTRHTATHAHTQTVAAKSRPTIRTHAAPIHAAPIVDESGATEKPSPADYVAAARVHAWEANQHNIATTPAATQPPAPIVHNVTPDDFIRASQPMDDDALPDEASTPVPQPVRNSVRAAKNTTQQPLTPSVAKMLPGSERETTPALADAEAQISPMIAPAMVPLVYNKRGRLIMPAALKGSHDILVHQNEMADAEGLDRIQDDDDLARKVAKRQLVALPVSAMLHVDERLPENRRYCRPWVAKFMTDIARAHYARFHTPLQVNSAVRTVEFQERLRRTNGNAAPVDGDIASPHLTGFAVDIAKHPLSQTEIAWMRGYLLPLEQQGKIDVEEEFQQACFHMSVYTKYMPAPSISPKRSQPASSTTNILATSLR